MVNEKKNWTRRRFALSLGAAAIAAAGCERKKPVSEARRFPSIFRWGCGSSAFQVEGALDVDGRGESIWDVFAKQNGRIKDGSIPSITCDSYHRYKEDVALMSAANLNSYKFSIAWPRVFPSGSGPVNERGIDYYDRLTDVLLQSHITPYATLFHWDLPQRLYELGGWMSRDTGERFADYAAAVTRRLGDRLKNFITLNEPNVHLLLGHVTGSHAPGLHDGNLIGPVTHHLNLAQGRAIQAMRAQRNDLTIGTGLALSPVRAEGGRIHLLNYFAALAFDGIWAGAFLDPLLKGKYPLAAHQMVADVIKPGDMSTIHQGCDFIGVNYYSPAYMRADFSGPSFLGQGKTPAGVTQDASGREIDPSGLREVLNRLTKEYGQPRLIVTENGCSDPMGDHAAIINDEFRSHYLSAHLRAVIQAMDNGSPVEGFFVWSLLDNWEWDSGFTSKFGLVAHNVNTGERTPKKSYAWFANIAETGLLSA
jgi:beta-glucosidase